MHRFLWPNNGKALKENVIAGKKYRFTMLTERLIRMEYDENGVFEDRATQHVFHRDFPASRYTVKEDGGLLTVETDFLVMKYEKEAAFTKDSLSVQLKDAPYTIWHYGDKLSNLKGTVRTLDRGDGAVPLEDGVCSRQGIAIVDDSDCMVLDGDWVGLRNPETDVYVFAFGNDYRSAVQELLILTGEPPMLPDYALGNWWSRYHAYTEEEYCDLVKRFEKERLPFSVAVVDMDWHLVDDVPDDSAWDGMNGKLGWTGYSWNKKLFPDYKRFLKFLHDHNLRTTLNLHPAQGVRYFEDMYEDMCKVTGQDPTTKEPVKLNLLNPEFMEHYFDVLHHPYEESGVDFWWMDWQQGKNYWWIHDEKHQPSPLEKMDPLWLLNHLHILDINRNGKRPMFFSRYAGVGSQRYPIGFSGDTVINWESLDFQAYFTNTATNVGYVWWSHDIGGHMAGYRDDELATRWVQYGVFSPINRLHSTKNEFTSKEPWKFGREHEQVQGNFLRLRHRMFPYNYSMNYRTATEGLALVEPLYYEYPTRDEAYEFKNQYLFGSQLMVSPITQKSDSVTQMGRVKTWFPEGEWYDAFLGIRYEGDQVLDVYRFLSEYPVFAKAGAIVPMQQDKGNNILGRSDAMELYVFPGADGHFTMFEDCGDYDRWETGECAFTEFDMKWSEAPVITIAPATGDLSILPAKRSYRVALRGWAKDLQVKTDLPFETEYDAERNTLYITIDVETAVGATFTIEGETLIADKTAAMTRALNILTRAQADNEWKRNTYEHFDRGEWRMASGANERHVMSAMQEMSGRLSARPMPQKRKIDKG